MPVAEVNGVRLNYSQLSYKGSGPAEDLVMLHGLAANMAFWLMHYGQAFAKRFRVTLYDLRGHGRSQLTDSGYTPNDMAADLKGLLDHLGIEKAHFMAHSFGGIAALKLACGQPKRFSSLVIADTHISLGRKKARTSAWESGETVQKILHDCGMPLDVKHPYFGYHLITAIARFRCDGREVPRELSPWVKHILGGSSTKTAEKWLTLMETRAEGELTSDDSLTENILKNIACPVLALYGEKSQALASGRVLASVLPQAEFVSVPDSGHFFPQSRPDFVKYVCEQFWNGNLSGRAEVHENVG